MNRSDILLAAMFAVIFAYFGVVMALTQRLKAKYPDAWSSMNQFTLIANNSPSGGFKFLRYFIFSNRYRALGDSRLDRLALAARVLFGVWAVLFLANGAGVFMPR